ncbi:unnamed protein product [Heligmosomoides polygyrus]|uniref:Col_cuticle_N domain-containing protein n=1 Tax=Heligmosomoides polygyrus TaxID=6339 RepID=A0A183F627_HELPZ|nr:unnamed protein product [Heligmosomoides polygyrus]
MDTSPEMFLIVLAIAMCSILFCFTIGVIVIFRCCEIKEVQLHNIPSAMLERTRNSINWARNSIFGHQPEECEDVVEDNQQFLTPQRALLKPSSPTAV